MPRDNICMYMVHVFFYVCCSDCVGMSVVYRLLLKIVVFWALNYVVCLCKGCDVVFYVCIVTCGAVGACVWEV